MAGSDSLQRHPQAALGSLEVAGGDVHAAGMVGDLGPRTRGRVSVEQLAGRRQHRRCLLGAAALGQHHRQRHGHVRLGGAVTLPLTLDQQAHACDRRLGRLRPQPQRQRQVAEHRALLGDAGRRREMHQCLLVRLGRVAVAGLGLVGEPPPQPGPDEAGSVARLLERRDRPFHRPAQLDAGAGGCPQRVGVSHQGPLLVSAIGQLDRCRERLVERSPCALELAHQQLGQCQLRQQLEPGRPLVGVQRGRPRQQVGCRRRVHPPLRAGAGLGQRAAGAGGELRGPPRRVVRAPPAAGRPAPGGSRSRRRSRALRPDRPCPSRPTNRSCSSARRRLGMRA